VNGEPCRRASGSFRAHFSSKAEAEAFANDPKNADYRGDIAHLCPKCFRWHLSRPEWLVPEHQRVMTTVN
jgi:hypothetical protein